MCCCNSSQRLDPSTIKNELSVADKLVYKTVEYEGPLTLKDLVEETGLSRRAVAESLPELQERELVEERPNLRDARQKFYVVATEL